jgi:malate synthase
VPADTYQRYYEPAKELISRLCLSDEFTDFLTLPAYEQVS